MFLFIAFAAILGVTFGTMALVTSSSRTQRIVDRRLVGIISNENESMGLQPQAQLLLKPRSDGGWFSDMLQEYSIFRRLDKTIIQADVKTTTTTIVLSSIGCTAAGVIITYIWCPLVVVQLIVGLVLGSLPFLFLNFKRSRRLKLLGNALPDAIDMMARALRAGHSMSASINVVAEQSAEPVRSEFSEVFKQQNFGLPLRDAMQQMLERAPSQDLRVLITAILVQKETGGNLIEILDRTANTIRERLKIQGEIRTHTAQGRMTGWILCALPIVMLGAINFINPGYSDVLVDTPIGHTLAYTGVGLLVIGGLIIRQIINGIEV